MDRLRIKRSTDRYRENIQGVANDAGLEQEEIEEIFREDQIIVAIRNGDFLGFVSFRYTDSTAKITALAVEKRFRRKGLAPRLLKEAEESAKNGECERMEAETSNDNIPALTFSKSMILELSMWKRAVLSDTMEVRKEAGRIYQLGTL